MISSSACLARLAESAWLRTCEALRRSGPGVGPLSAARAWCESGMEHLEDPSTHQHQFGGSDLSPDSRPVPHPAFRPPSYQAKSVSHEPVEADVMNSRGYSVPESTFKPSASGPSRHMPSERGSRLVDSSSTSEISLEYYSTAGADPAEAGLQATSSSPRERLVSNNDGQREYSRRNKVRDREGDGVDTTSAVRPALQMYHNTSQDLLVNHHQKLQDTESNRDSFSPRSRTTLSSEDLVQGYESPRMPLAIPRTYSPIIHSGSSATTLNFRGTDASEYSFEPRRAAVSGTKIRPVTPNLPATNSPSWVGKGLRRLSMPTFTSNR